MSIDWSLQTIEDLKQNKNMPNACDRERNTKFECVGQMSFNGLRDRILEFIQS